MRCIAHRLELAIKDALKPTYFDKVDDMLLRLYLLYEKSPKTCRELEKIVSHLKRLVTMLSTVDDRGMIGISRRSRHATARGIEEIQKPS